MFGITGGYHRYFAHRSYKTSRVFQFVLAWLGCSAVQKGPLWWAAHHRHHHRYSDTPEDLHSPATSGFWWSHVGWILSRKHARAPTATTIRDFAKLPRAALARTATTGCRASLLAVVLLPDRRLERRWCGASSSAPCCSTTAPSRSTRSATCSAAAATRPTDDSRNNWLVALHHAGRGLAQQPPPLPELGQPGLLLVGDRHQLLHPQDAWSASASSGTCRKPPKKRLTLNRVSRPKKRKRTRRQLMVPAAAGGKPTSAPPGTPASRPPAAPSGRGTAAPASATSSARTAPSPCPPAGGFPCPAQSRSTTPCRSSPTNTPV